MATLEQNIMIHKRQVGNDSLIVVPLCMVQTFTRAWLDVKVTLRLHPERGSQMLRGSLGLQ